VNIQHRIHYIPCQFLSPQHGTRAVLSS